MSVFEQFMHMYSGFETEKSELVDMPVPMLYAEAMAEASYRGEEDTEEAKDIIFQDGDEPYYDSPRLYRLKREWDIAKCEPLDIKREGTFLMINNGFHRIKVAHDLGVPTLKVQLQDGHFILNRHISMYDLRDLVKMLIIMFKEQPTLQSLDDYLSDKSFDESKMKHTFVGFGYLRKGESK